MSRLNPDNVEYLVVHCADTQPNLDVGAKEIRRWHVKENGWADIGYHFVIRRCPNDQGEYLETGRPLDVIGAHVAGYNACSIGICLVGGQSVSGRPENNFTDEQFEVLGQLLVRLQQMFPDAYIQGHRDFEGVTKYFPSFDAIAWAEAQGLQ
jgi:hypothetical protein